jgi:hypothetical protein
MNIADSASQKKFLECVRRIERIDYGMECYHRIKNIAETCDPWKWDHAHTQCECSKVDHPPIVYCCDGLWYDCI